MARRAVLLVVDSLRPDLIRPDTMPALARLLPSVCRFDAHRSVFPSTTRTASASISTGCLPRHHGLLGNSMCIDEGAGLVCLSTGKADFRERLRAARGRVLHRPALPERLAQHGGVVMCSNVSAGAAHFLDPDGHGFLYHRDGSHGPGLKALTADRHLSPAKGGPGDLTMTERFVAEALAGPHPGSADGTPALAVLWLSEPDYTGHLEPLLGPKHRAALAAADQCVEQVVEAVQRLDPTGRDTLLIITSDHGNETVDRVIDVNAGLVEAGLRAAPDSPELVPAPQGTSVVFYAAPEARGRVPALLEWLGTQDWVGELFAGEALGPVGLDHGFQVAAAVSMRKTAADNAYGVPGLSDIMFEPGGLNRVGAGQHGGTGPYEMRPLLLALGGGFPTAARRDDPTSCIDLAPTILRHLGRTAEGMDGRALQDA